jgi:CHAT domain-containing protein
MAIFPIETLKNSNGQYLIENNSILYLYSTSQLVDSMDYTEYMNEVTCFAPGFLSNTQDQMHDTLHRGVSLNPLPYSIQECQQIDSVFTKNSSTSLRLHYDANTNNFFNDITNSKIIHIATHGIASKNSLNNTGIFLYNDHKGIDFISFDKIKNNSIKAELTVLSACKTAEGMEVDGEGKMSLSYGFMFAGSKNVIASLWDVSDKVTRELMLDFYSNIKNEKMSYSEAMQKAKIDFIKKGYSPIDWGSFILLGR